MRFVPTSSQAVAEALSTHLWSLSLPPEHRGANVTAALFDTRTDAAGSVWLCVIEDYQIPVHPEAVLDGIADILAGAGISAEDIAALDALVISKRGSTLTPWEYFPQPFKGASKLETEINWPART